jgi:hypothetical protein
MPSEFSIYDAGAWRSIYDTHVHTGGGWSRVQNGYVWTGSAWSNFYNYDITGPGAATNLLARWSNGYGVACYVTWNQPTDADFSYSLLQKSTNTGASWETVATRTQGPGVFCDFLDFGVTLGAYTVHNAVNQASTSPHYYRVLPYDDKGNLGTIVTAGSTSMAGGAIRGYLSSPYYYNSNGSASYLWGNNDWASGVSQGYQDVFGNGRRFGHFFYDNSTSHTFEVSSASILMRRKSGAGINNGIPVGTRGSYAGLEYIFPTTVNPVPALATGTIFSGAYSWGTTDWATVGADVAAQIVANGYNSVVIDAEQNSVNTGYGYSSYYSSWDDQTVDLFANILFGGTLRIYHSG